MSQQRGGSMKSWGQEWARGLKQWLLWLMGDAPLPGKRSRAVLAGTVAIVAVLAVGAVIGSRLPVVTGGGSTNGSGQTDAVNQVPVPTPTAGSGNQSSGSRSATATTTKTAADAGKPAGTHPGARKPGSHKKGDTKAGSVAPGSTTTTTGVGGLSNLALGPAATTATPSATSSLPDFVPSVEPGPSAPTTVAAPGAPFAIGATSGDTNSHLTWSAPSDQGTSSITGYNVYVGIHPGASIPSP